MTLTSNFYPNDKEWKNDWDETPGGGNWGMAAIHAPEMWEYRDQMDWVSVGVFDGQFDTGHPDLVFADTLFNDPKPNKNAEHGTFVSGIIAAGFDNKIGVAGVMPKVRLYGASHLGIEANHVDNGGNITVYAYTAGLTWLIARKCKVINCSNGFNEARLAATKGAAWAKAKINGFNKQLEKSLLALLAMGEDFVIVKAAGNSGAEDDAQYDILAGITNPILRDRIIVVGAGELVNGKIRICDSSTGGDRVDIIAPGAGIWSTSVSISTSPNHYAWPAGKKKEGFTSVAAPFVSGVAAAVWGVNGKLTGAEVKKIIIEGADLQRHTLVVDGLNDIVNKFLFLDAQTAVEKALNWAGEGDALRAYDAVVRGEMPYTYGTLVYESNGIQYSSKGGHYSSYDGKNEFAYLDKMEGGFEVEAFAIVNMDGMGAPEVVLRCAVPGGGMYARILVLHYENGTVYSYEFSERGMEELKQDGTHYGSSGAMDGAFEMLLFSGGFCNAQKLAESVSSQRNGTTYVDYFIDGKVVSEEEYWVLAATQRAKEDVMWQENTAPARAAAFGVA
jgi:subtilisin family serine protease